MTNIVNLGGLLRATSASLCKNIVNFQAGTNWLVIKANLAFYKRTAVVLW